MSDVNANIRVNIDTQHAQQQLQALQTQIQMMQKTMAAQAKSNMNLGFGNTKELKGVSQEIVQVASATKTLDKALAGTSRSIGASFKTMGEAFRGNGTAMDLAVQRGRILGAQYDNLGMSARGLGTALKTVDFSSVDVASATSAQRVAIFTRAMDQAGTSMLNWGKNMQWAGRQLMVGFTVPLTIFGAIAIKTFQDIEREVVNLQRVYGDFTTSSAETDRMTASIKDLAVEMTKLGYTAKDTIALAADAAATGAQGQDLMDITKNATQLAALGMISQEQALDTMISMNSAFGVAADELKGTVDFLNAVENQTVLSLSDMTEAIPLVAPVIQGLGGDVKDLAVLMTAMREGGVGANEAANSLKTSLARLVTPTRKASETALAFGINLDKIVATNEGDLLGMIGELSEAMSHLSELQQQQVLSDVFGKMQFARMGALFANFNKEGSQASKTMDLMGASAEDLARQTDKELAALSESTSMQFTSAIESLKMAIAPIGEQFMKALLPFLEFGQKILNWFNQLPEGAKNFTTILAAGLGVVIPSVLMLVGLFANLGGNLLNLLKGIISFVTNVNNAGGAVNYLTMEQLEQAIAAERLAGAQQSVTAALNSQKQAVNQLITAYNGLAATSGAASMPMQRFATGGRVGGVGNTDKVPALLTPGEFVVKKSVSQKHSGFLHALNSGQVRGFSGGGSTSQDKVTTRLKDWGFSEEEIAAAVERGVAAGAKNIGDYLKAEFGPMASYGKYTNGGDIDVQAAHVYPQMKSGAEGLTTALEAAENGLIRLTAAQELELKNLNDANTALAAAGKSPLGKAALTTNLTYDSEKMANQAFANTGLSGADTAASLARTRGSGMSTIERQMENAGELAADQITSGSSAMQAALERQARELGENTVVVDDATSELADNVRTSGREVVEFGELWNRAEAEISQAHAAYVEEQRKLQAEFAQIRIMTRKLGSEDEGILAAAGIDARDVSRTSASGNAVNRTVITTDRGTSDSRRGNVESKSLLSSDKSFDKVTSQLRKEGVFSVESVEQARMAATAQVDAYIDAIESRVAEVNAAGAKLGDALGDGVENSLEISSPSRRLKRAAREGGRGIVEGVNEAVPEVKAAGTILGNKMEEGFDEGADGHQAGRDFANEAAAGANGSGGSVTQAGGQSGRQYMRSKAGMAGMVGGQAISMMSGMAYGMQDDQGKILGVNAELVSSFGMVAGQVNSFASMFGPKGQAVAAIGTAVVGAVGYGVAKWREAVDQASRAASLLGASLGGAAGVATKMADMFGQSTLLQKKGQLQLTEEQKTKFEEYRPMFESEAGQKMIEDLKELTSSERYAAIEEYVNNAVIQGFVEATDASTFAQAFTSFMGEEGMGAALAHSVEEFNKSYTNSTERAVALAEKRTKAIEDSAKMQNFEGTMGRGGTASYEQSSFVVGASMQAIEDWSTAAERARLDYQDGIITFNEYNDIVQRSTELMRQYSGAIEYAINNNNDSGGVDQAVKTSLERMGYNEDQIGNVREDVEQRVATEKLERHRAEIATKRLQLEAEYNKELERKIQESMDTRGWDRPTAEMDARSKMYGSAESMALQSLSNERFYYTDEQKTKDVNDVMSAIVTAVGQGMDLDQAKEVGQMITDETSIVGQVYQDAMNAGKSKFDAMQAAIAGWNIQQDATNPLSNDPDLFARWMAQQMASADPTAMGNITGNMSGSQIGRTVSALESFRPSTYQTGQGVVAGNYENRDKLESLLNANIDTLGPEITSRLAPYAADALNEGIQEGGLAGISQLSKLLGGKEEAITKYLDVALADGSLSEDEIQAIVNLLEYANERIPKELQVKIGFDPQDSAWLAQMASGDAEAAIDNMAIMANMVEGLPDDQKDVGVAFTFDAFGKPIKSSAQFRKQFQGVMDDVNELDGKDLTTKRTMMIDIQQTLNGAEATPERVNNAMDALTEKFGAAGVANISPTTLTKVVDMQVDAQALIDKATELEALAKIPGLGAAGMELASQATELKERAQALNDAAFDAAAPEVWGGGGTDSGGGGGGGGTWELDNKYGNMNHKKTWTSYIKGEKAKAVGKIGWIEWLRKNTSLTEDAIQELTTNEEKWKEFQNNRSKYEQEAMKEGLTNARDTNRANRERSGREAKVDASGLDYFIKEQIKADDDLLAAYDKGGKFRKQALQIARERAMTETTILDIVNRKIELQQKELENEEAVLNLRKEIAEYDINMAYDTAGNEERIKTLEAEAAYITASQIDPINKKIEKEKDLIKAIEREYEVNEDNIKSLNKQVDAKQRQADSMKRTLELAMRESDALDHDLKLMGYQEEEINSIYDKRLDTLDKVLEINEAIAASQQTQLGLADALSRGDIGAAAKAAAEMQQQQQEFAAEQYRRNLENSRESAIGSLVGANSGMTREQIEQRQRELEELSYQTNLKIRDIEDDIYDLNINIRNENDIINGYKELIEDHNKNIRNYEWDIFSIEQGRLKTIGDQVTAMKTVLAQAEWQKAVATEQTRIDLYRLDQMRTITDAHNNALLSTLELYESQGAQLTMNAKLIHANAVEAKKLWDAMNSGASVSGMSLPKAIKRMTNFSFTPATKSTTMADLEKQLGSWSLDTGKVSMPTYSLPNSASSGIMNGIAGGTSNFMNNNVNINASSANANEVANLVIQKLELLKTQNVGGI